MDEELYDQLLEDARVAADEVDYHMGEQERERFIERYIERQIKDQGLS